LSSRYCDNLFENVQNMQIWSNVEGNAFKCEMSFQVFQVHTSLKEHVNCARDGFAKQNTCTI